MPDDPTVLGKVQDVAGQTVSVVLDEDTVSGLTFVSGHGYRIGQVGSFVRIPIGYANLFGVVSQVGAGAVPERLVAEKPHGYRWMTVQLVGETAGRDGFKRGISQYPTIGDRVHIVVEDDLFTIFGAVAENDGFVRIGHLASSEAVPALVDLNKLVTRHSAVVGTTGSGKSTTVAGLLASVCSVEDTSPRVIVLDIHGEYAAALRKWANVYRINSSAERGELPLFIPYWAMTFDEVLPIALGEMDDVSRRSVLEKVLSLKKEALQSVARSGVTEDTLTVDTPVPFSIHRLWFDLHLAVCATFTAAGAAQSAETIAYVLNDNNEPVQSGDALKVVPPLCRPNTLAAGENKVYLSASNLNIRRHLDGLASRLRDARYDFLFRPGPWMPSEGGVPAEDLDTVLAGWIGGPRPITVLDLSGVPSPVLNHTIGVLLRILYDSLSWARRLSEGGVERPVLVVLEEAHAYLGKADMGSAGLAVRRIVKEGRKYGIGAMLVSQRPAEIDSTILSQCGSILAMRLSNPTDRGHVTSTVSDNLEGLMSMLPVLRTGEAIIVGEATPVPMRTVIDPPPKHRRPDSEDPFVHVPLNEEGVPSLPGGWNRRLERGNFSDVCTVWRSQDIRSPRVFNWKGRDDVVRETVSSSNLASVGYDSDTQTLEVEFVNGSIYQYFDVPELVHVGLMSADSHGIYFNRNIRGVYRYARI